MRRAILFLGGLLCLATLSVGAQENRSEISVQGTGFFTNGVQGNGTAYSATETGGFLATYRYHMNRWVSLEGAYGYEVNSQKYGLSSGGFRIQSGINQLTGSLVLNLPNRGHSRFNPYILAGGGALIFEPTGNQFDTFSGAQGQAKGVFTYGVGVNYALSKRISMRAEYRGLVYDPPDFGFGILVTNSVTQTMVPSVGFTYRF
jgi:outer membrane autotransporter protein